VQQYTLNIFEVKKHENCENHTNKDISKKQMFKLAVANLIHKFMISNNKGFAIGILKEIQGQPCRF